MIPIEELRRENNEISDLSKVLSCLVSDSSLHENDVFCELLERFQNKLDQHLKHEARSLYPELLNHNDKNTKQTAHDFVSNTHELERILSKHARRWCHQIKENGHEDFKNETKEVFRLVNERIQMEEKYLFPVL